MALLIFFLSRYLIMNSSKAHYTSSKKAHFVERPYKQRKAKVPKVKQTDPLDSPDPPNPPLENRKRKHEDSKEVLPIVPKKQSKNSRKRQRRLEEKKEQKEEVGELLPIGNEDGEDEVQVSSNVLSPHEVMEAKLDLVNGVPTFHFTKIYSEEMIQAFLEKHASQHLKHFEEIVRQCIYSPWDFKRIITKICSLSSNAEYDSFTLNRDTITFSTLTTFHGFGRGGRMANESEQFISDVLLKYYDYMKQTLTFLKTLDETLVKGKKKGYSKYMIYRVITLEHFIMFPRDFSLPLLLYKPYTIKDVGDCIQKSKCPSIRNFDDEE